MDKLKYKDKVFDGGMFPDAPIHYDLKTKIGSSVQNKYIPALNKVLENDTYGMRLLCTVMTIKEGYYPGTRSFKYNNPGNIGNTDNGSNKGFKSLEAGIQAQRDYVLSIVNGRHKAYPIGKPIFIKPYFSKEIDRNPQYGLPPYLPGYRFVFTGEIQQFVKIYSTGARAGNSYVSMIVSWFRSHGFKTVNERTTLQELIEMK